MAHHRVAITGLGCLGPNGSGCEALARALARGERNGALVRARAS